MLQEFAAAAGQGASVEQVRGQAQRFAQRPDVLATVRGELTTENLVDCERRLIAAALDRAGERVAVVDSRTVDRVIAAAERPLTAEQAAVVRAATGSGRGVDVVQALAGTGKTYTAGVVRAVYEDAGYHVLGVAPTGRAARELTEQAGIPARTLDRLLIDLDQLGDKLPRRCVVVFDEAGMAPTRATAGLLEAAERAGAKVVAIGDPGQLASVQAGGWLRAVGRELGALRLTEVMRQRDPAERRALAALHERLPGRYLEWAQRAGRIATCGDAAGAREQAITGWASAATEVGVEQAVMIARENDMRSALNHAARELRRDQGALGEQRSYGPRELAVGDRVICRRNDALLDVDNGTRGTVRQLDQGRVVIETDSRLVRELPAAYVAEHVEHAYALTGHGMQGGTVEAAIVVATPRDLTAGWSYTALSRARGNTTLLIHDDQLSRERADHAPEQRHQPADRSELLARTERRMLQRDDENLAIEQLPPAGAPDDRQLALALDHAGEPAQEHAALRAEPSTRDPASEARLRELRDRLEQLAAQRAALPSAHLQQLDDSHARGLALEAQRADLVERLAQLPTPRGRLVGRARDPHAAERARIASAIPGADRELAGLRNEQTRLTRQLGDPDHARRERDSLDRAINSTEREHTELRDQLAERELERPSEWVQRTFGERPTRPVSRATWEQGVRHVARYRLDHHISDPGEPLGPQPTPGGEHQRDWHNTRSMIDRTQRNLGLNRDIGLDIGLDVGL